MKNKYIDGMPGQKFAKLTVISRGENYRNKTRWNCLCECGNTYLALGTLLKTGRTTHCGCMTGELKSKAKTKHGLAKTPEHVAWSAMKTRCCNPNTKSYSYYGGRGITICDRWLESFENFLADMGEKPSKNHSLERNDSNGNYEPGNCKWATKSEQAVNRRGKVSKSGHRGVYKEKLRWKVDIKVSNKRVYVGLYPTLEQAVAARKQAEEKYRTT